MSDRSSPHPFLSLLRFWLPSWKFFVEIGPEPCLFYRVGSEGNELGPWIPCFEKRSRHLGEVLLNAEGNFQLACGNLLTRFLQELSELPIGSDGDVADLVAGSVSYRLIANLVRQTIRKKDPAPGGKRFQFKVCLVNDGFSEPSPEDVIVSSEHEV